MIKLEHIYKTYQPSTDVRIEALKNINLTIKQGEFTAILGTSGSGKSTLLYIIGLLEKPSRGIVTVNGENTSIMSDGALSIIRNQTIGFIFQQFNLIPKLNVIENVLLPTLYSPTGTTKKHQEYVLYLLDACGITDKKNAFPNQLSGGQQQRVAIARALINKPEVIIADEPTGNLDSKTSTQIIDLVKKIHQQEHKTVLLVTHDSSIAQKAQRIIHIKDGALTKQ